MPIIGILVLCAYYYAIIMPIMPITPTMPIMPIRHNMHHRHNNRHNNTTPIIGLIIGVL